MPGSLPNDQRCVMKRRIDAVLQGLLSTKPFFANGDIRVPRVLVLVALRLVERKRGQLAGRGIGEKPVSKSFRCSVRAAAALSEAEIADLVAFLTSLRGGDQR